MKGADEFNATETLGDNYDYMLGGRGADQIWGGDGADTIVGGDGRDAIYGEGGNDTLKGADEFSARETVGDNMDYILGGVGSDAIWGGDGADTLVGGNGNDSLFGEDGNDTMKGADEFNAYETTGNNADYMLGGAGNDAMWGGNGNDTLVGGDGSDALYGEIGEDILKGAQEFNAHEAGGDADLLDGGIGNDTLWGGDGDDALHGGPGTDRLYGEAGNDGLFAGMGDGVESLLGGPGADRFLTLDGEDVIQDREGIDARIAFRNSPALSGVKLAGQPGTYSFAAGSWNNAEVDRVDVALANLHHHTGNTRLLKTAARGEMSFLAVGMQTSPGFQAGGWNSGSEIAFVNLPAIATSYIQRTVYHEFGHNWDDQSENRFVNTFRAVSGWQVHNNDGGSLFPPAGYNGSLDGAWDYRASAVNTFAREYGKTNPNEDMASTWEAYFVNAYHGGAAQLVVEGLTMNGAKWATLDSLFGDLRAAW